MERTNEACGQYRYAVKRAKKNVRKLLRERRNIHPAILRDVVNADECTAEYLGEIKVPSVLIVGTGTAEQALSYSADFMPLPKENSEFADGWRSICLDHLSDAGIRELPVAYEYLGRFYITEGDKPVSVLKSYGAIFISLDVTRLIPSDTKRYSTHLYQSFLDFYKLSGLYSIQFSRPDSYDRFRRLLGFEEGHVWTETERIRLAGFFERLVTHLNEAGITADPCDCLLAMLDIRGYPAVLAMNDAELDQVIAENRRRLMNGHGLYRIMCVADEEDPGLYSEYAKTELKETDFLISCGDLHSEYLEFLVTLSNKPLYYVHGNHDSRYDRDPPEGCICIDDDLVIHQGIRILGLGGSVRYSQDKYQYTEKEMEKRIRKLRRKIRRAGGVDIVVTHAPIRGYGDLEDYAHRGFACFEKLLKELRPKYWLYGHVHLRYRHGLPRTIEYGKTQIINCSDKYEIIY